MISFLKISLFSALSFYLALACQHSGGDQSGVQHTSTSASADAGSAYDDSSAYDTPYNSAYAGTSSDDGAINCGYDAGANRILDSFTAGAMSVASHGTVTAHAINCRADANLDSAKVISFRKNKVLNFASQLKLDERGICWFKVTANRCWIAGRPSMLLLND